MSKKRTTMVECDACNEQIELADAKSAGWYRLRLGQLGTKLPMYADLCPTDGERITGELGKTG